MGFPPSTQQKTVYKWVRDGNGNLILIAVAGAGKTTTILNAAFLMQGAVAICAYNKKIADEIKLKLEGAGMPKRIQAGTFHSFGLRNWRNMHRDITIDGRKMQGLASQAKVPEKLLDFTLELVSLGKQRAMGVLTPVDDYAEWMRIVNHYDIDSKLPDADNDTIRTQIVEDGIGCATVLLEKSAEIDDKVIDYDDMIYAPLRHECRIWQNDWILVDEAQDTNPARRALAKKMLRPGGRAIFVGDPAQAIYGFTGADNDSLDRIKDEFGCEELPLTVTYRCPKAVVAMAQLYVSHIQAADSAPEGKVSVITGDEFRAIPPERFTPNAAMLCRNTAPLVSYAYMLLRRGIPCHVEGKAIGTGILNLIKKFRTTSLDELRTQLSEYREKEVSQLMAKGQEQKAELLSDRVDTIYVIMDTLFADSTVQDLREKVMGLFGDTQEDQPAKGFTLSTVHKSKGREWDTVYLLDRMKYMPSRFARQKWQKDQEINLIYVAITRSKGELIEVLS